MALLTVAVLGFGEVGNALAQGLAKSDGTVDPVRVVVSDPLAASARGAWMQAAADRIGATLHAEPGGWLRDADLVVSAVTGKMAVTVAEMAAPHLRPGTVFADVNTATPETMRAAAKVIEARKAAFLDVAIMGSIDTHRHATPMLVAGDRAGELEAWLNPLGFRIRAIPGNPGDASALKLLRSVFTKGLEALCVEAFVTASRFGMADQVIENLSDLEQKGFAEMIRMLVTTHCRHARRRLDEVRSLSALFVEAGVSPVMTNATESVFQRTVDSPIPEWASGDQMLSLNECLDRLRVIASDSDPKRD